MSVLFEEYHDGIVLELHQEEIKGAELLAKLRDFFTFIANSESKKSVTIDLSGVMAVEPAFWEVVRLFRLQLCISGRRFKFAAPAGMVLESFHQYLGKSGIELEAAVAPITYISKPA